jgi:hypothetical protein
MMVPILQENMIRSGTIDRARDGRLSSAALAGTHYCLRVWSRPVSRSPAGME